MSHKIIKLTKNGKIKLSETDIKHQIKSYLKQQNIFFWHNLQGLGAYKGLPDISGLTHKGTPFFIEVKTARGKTSDWQNEFLARATGLHAWICVPHSFEEFEEFWKEVEKQED